MLTTAINTSQSWGTADSSDAPTLTLNIKDEPLKTVFEKFSRATGYQISIDEEWTDLIVSASLKNASLYESTRRILTNQNHAIIINDIEKKLTVTIYDKRVLSKIQKKVGSDFQQIVDFRDLEVIPPDKPGGRGITQRELDVILARENNIDPLDVEVIPPKNPGEIGVTQRELDVILARENNIDPLDVEVIPPKNPGERGVTQRELDAILDSGKTIDPLDVEVIPPKIPGEKGITQRELNAILARENKINPLDLEVIPPKNPGERGVTQRELDAMRANDNQK
ncbi:hypothetical protein DSCA_10090 [Desulfosarcina alkanivorans]|uniref:Uncharacterized protein n=2 Tax=Desulfosarcina alkanivorans TaxID=571177 RepID=A0A5K7YGX9_9BACT|nr:hypothetical protein DSCA_10090 [Desulfosarcina alkanivorans]